jgi:hypothetical protein
LPDAPTPVQETQSQQPQSGQSDTSQSKSSALTKPVTSGVDMFLRLQNKSLVFPDLATTEGVLSPWEKFKLAANNSVSLSTVGSAIIGSLYGQATNSPEGYHQGWEGYGKRFGADMARSASYNMFGNFALASVMHQDPRFYVKKDLNFWQSVEYSAERVVITRTDSGRSVPNYSGLIGNLGAEALANSYYPKGNNGASDIFIRYGIDLGWRFGGHLLRQYWPEINRRLAMSSGTAAPGTAVPPADH